MSPCKPKLFGIFWRLSTWCFWWNNFSLSCDEAYFWTSLKKNNECFVNVILHNRCRYNPVLGGSLFLLKHLVLSFWIFLKDCQISSKNWTFEVGSVTDSLIFSKNCPLRQVLCFFENCRSGLHIPDTRVFLWRSQVGLILCFEVCPNGLVDHGGQCWMLWTWCTYYKWIVGILSQI